MYKRNGAIRSSGRRTDSTGIRISPTARFGSTLLSQMNRNTFGRKVWERTARGGLEAKLYTWGDEPPQSQPRYPELWRTGPERVGRRPTNGFELFDISENVHEWLAHWYDANYYSVSPPRNPQGPAEGVRRASRGGSWRHQIKIARVAAQQPPTGVSIQRLRVPLRAEFMTWTSARKNSESFR
jgi:sulfatase-modifying factor enzyme 1